MKYHPVSILLLLLLLSLLLLLVLLEGARASTGLCVHVISSHVVSFAELSRIVHVRRGGGAPSFEDCLTIKSLWSKAVVWCAFARV